MVMLGRRKPVAWRRELLDPSPPTAVCREGDGADTRIVVVVECSICRHVTKRPFSRSLPNMGGNSEGDPGRDDLGDPMIFCDCAYEHPGRPAGGMGCGRRWQVVLKGREGD